MTTRCPRSACARWLDRLLTCTVILWALAVFGARAAELTPSRSATLFRAARFDQNLGAQIPLDGAFRDEHGQPVALRGLLGQRPAILVLGYHDCPMLCSLVLGGLVEALSEMRSTSGTEYELIDVSISPRDTPTDAAKQKRIYFKRYARRGADQGWHFLTTPNQANISALSDAAGFRYAYEAETAQYSHPSGLIILTPEGKISRYFFGVHYDAGELQAALQAASHRRVSSPIAELLMVCFHFNPITGRYGPLILQCLRVAGVVTLITLGAGITYLLRRPVLPSPT